MEAHEATPAAAAAEEAPSQQQQQQQPTATTAQQLKGWASAVGWRALQVVDTVGEALAAFFGITDTKYPEELAEHERQQEARAAAATQEHERQSAAASALEAGVSSPPQF